MKTTSSKNILWKSNVALKLLFFFFENPTKEFFEKQIKEETKFSLGAVNKYLKLLAEENLLLFKKRGKMNFFRLNRENLVVKYLKIAYSLSSPLVLNLKKIGKRFGVKLYLYGSVARGEDDENSDWDVLVIGDVKINELESEINRIRKKFKKRLKLTIFKRNEWLIYQKKIQHFMKDLKRIKSG